MVRRVAAIRRAGAVLLLIVLLLVLLAKAWEADRTATVPAPEPEPPLSGEDLWRQLPVELLADVIEGKMEAISELEDDIATIRDIQAARQAGE